MFRILYPFSLDPPLLFFLGLILWDVDADCERASFCAVLVLHHKGVFARVNRGDSCNGHAGKLAMLKLECVVLIRQQKLVVLRPANFRSRVTPYIASEVKGLKWNKGRRNSAVKADWMVSVINDVKLLNKYTSTKCVLICAKQFPDLRPYGGPVSIINTK